MSRSIGQDTSDMASACSGVDDYPATSMLLYISDDSGSDTSSLSPSSSFSSSSERASSREASVSRSPFVSFASAGSQTCRPSILKKVKTVTWKDRLGSDKAADSSEDSDLLNEDLPRHTPKQNPSPFRLITASSRLFIHHPVLSSCLCAASMAGVLNAGCEGSDPVGKTLFWRGAQKKTKSTPQSSGSSDGDRWFNGQGVARNLVHIALGFAIGVAVASRRR